MSSKPEGDVTPENRDAENAFTQSELAFFGRITANVSHEFKNRLATINEKAGLLADLASMAEKGIRPLDSARIKSVAMDIARQVETADAACLRLNQFAHSVDMPERREDLVGLLGLIVRLIERQTLVAGVDIKVESGTEVEVETKPFLFQQVIYYCLIWAMDHSPSRTITLRMRQSEGRIFVIIKGATFDGLLRHPSEPLVRALRKLGGRLEANTEEPEVTLHL